MFSDREKKIIEIIGKKKLTIEEISVELFKGDRNAPFDKKITISNSISRINDKCEYHSLAWFLFKNKRSGEKMVVYKASAE